MYLNRALCSFVVSLFAILSFSMPANARWFRAESPHFIVYGANEAVLRKDVLRLENFDKMLRALVNIPSENSATKLSVYMVRDTNTVSELSSSKNSNIAGFYSARESGVIAVVPRQAEAGFDDIILFHEYAHHIMLKYFPKAYPAWYVEGFAEYLSTVTFEKGLAKIGLLANHRAYSLYGPYSRNEVAIDRLLNASVSDLRGEELDSFYARSWLLVHYLTFHPKRDGAQRKYLNLINSGISTQDAAIQAFGDLKTLNRDLDNYKEVNRFAALSYKMADAEGAITITPVDEQLGEAMHDKIRLTRGTLVPEREAIASRLRAQVVKAPGNGGLLTLLAEAELDLENYDAAIAAADRAISSDPTIARAFLWKGDAKLRILSKERSSDAAKWKEARSWIVKANRADSEDALALYIYYNSLKMEGRPVTSVAIEGLHKAVELLPQSSVFRISFATELAKKGEFESAKMTAQPIANSPHGGELAIRAKAFITVMDEAIQKSEAPKNIELIWAVPPKSEDKKGGDPGK